MLSGNNSRKNKGLSAFSVSAAAKSFQPCLTLCDTTELAHQAPLSIGFPKQEYWSGLPFPPPGDLPDPGIECVSPSLAGRFFTTEPPGKPHSLSYGMQSDLN